MRSLLILLALCQLCVAQTFDPNKKIDGHNQYNIARMPELPTGPEKLDCWIVLSDQWQSNPLEYAIAQAIATDPRMQQIKASTYFNYYTVSNPKFAQSGLIQAVGTATPILVVQRHDGAIRADGSAGLLVNARSCPQTAAGCVDMLCDAIGALNPPPRFEGQTLAPSIVREATAEQCPDGNCPPSVPLTPSYSGTLPTIRPASYFPYAAVGIGVLGFCAIASVAVGAVVYRATRVKV